MTFPVEKVRNVAESDHLRRLARLWLPDKITIVEGSRGEEPAISDLDLSIKFEPNERSFWLIIEDSFLDIWWINKLVLHYSIEVYPSFDRWLYLSYACDCHNHSFISTLSKVTIS